MKPTAKRAAKTVWIAAVMVATVAVGSLVGPSNIDPVDKWSWGENIGWMNWRDADGAADGVLVAADHLSGFIWMENAGWLNVGDGSAPYANTDGSNFGVNILGGGDLDGMAWGENIGWVNFGWAANSTDTDRARFDATAGRFRGFAWGENVGWVNLDDATHFPAVEISAPPPVSVDALEPDKERFLTIIVPAEAAGSDTALQLTLDSLYHPGEPLPVNPPDFSSLEGEVRYVNLLRDDNGDAVTSCLSSPSFSTFYACATLGCDPEYADWGAMFGGEPLHVTGAAILPDSQYRVTHLAATCAGNEIACPAASADVSVATARWGDADGSGAVNVTDVVVTVDVLKDVEGAAREYQCYVRSPAPQPHNDSTNVTDVVLHVDALKLFSYPVGVTACP